MTTRIAAFIITLVAGVLPAFLFSCSSVEQAPNRFLELLKYIPASFSQEFSLVTLNDYAKIREVYHVSIPSSDSDEDARQYFAAMFGTNSDPHGTVMGGLMSGHGQFAATVADQKTHLGYDRYEVDAGAVAGRPPEDFEIVAGRFSPDVTREALSMQDDWPETIREEYDQQKYRGLTMHSWGKGGINLTLRYEAPHLDALGRARPFALTRRNILYASSVSDLRWIIDTGANQIDSLADREEYALLARGLRDLGAYSAVMADESIANHAMVLPDIGNAPLLEPYLAFASGIGKDDAGLYMVILLAHNNAQSAGHNVRILQERIARVSWNKVESWSRFVRDPQVYAKGKIVLAKMYVREGPTFWHGWVMSGEPLLVDRLIPELPQSNVS